MNNPIWQSPAVIQHCKLIANSYHYWTKKQLFADATNDLELSKSIYYAPFIVVSHGTEKDPIFNYANLTAQNLWKLSWEEFTKLPSRLSAEPIEEARRNQLLEEGRNRGVTYLEKGIRISKEGKRFYIKDVVLFNLLGDNKEYLGQGAIYEKWEFISE
ncbi:MAG TPA: MEKHLA domain-containing protein [Cytophagaceae bacterium]